MEVGRAQVGCRAPLQKRLGSVLDHALIQVLSAASDCQAARGLGCSPNRSHPYLRRGETPSSGCCAKRDVLVPAQVLGKPGEVCPKRVTYSPPIIKLDRVSRSMIARGRTDDESLVTRGKEGIWTTVHHWMRGALHEAAHSVHVLAVACIRYFCPELGPFLPDV